MDHPIKLHIGGTQAKAGWTILNVLPGPDVDVLGSCTDLSMFADGSVEEAYASHVLEHLDTDELPVAVKEVCRVLKPGGLFKISVPDLATLCRLYLETGTDVENQSYVMRLIYGGHTDRFDVHHYGFSLELLANVLAFAGFTGIKPVAELGEFEDTSVRHYAGVPISLNCIARK